MVAKLFVDVVFPPVAFVQVRFAKEDGALPMTERLVMVAVDAITLVAVRFVTVWFVTNAFVEVVFVNSPFVAKRLVAVAFVIVPFVMCAFVPNRFVAKRFVVVAFVDVTLSKFPFQRSDEEPNARRPSAVGNRSVVMPPRSARFVVVTLVPDWFVKLNDVMMPFEA